MRRYTRQDKGTTLSRNPSPTIISKNSSDIYDIFHVEFLDWTMKHAVKELGKIFNEHALKAHPVFFPNAATLNIAWGNPAFKNALRSAYYVFGDGTGARWAALLLHNRQLLGNVNGTDFVPSLLTAHGGLGYKYFILGTTKHAVTNAADFAGRRFKGWSLCGYHHGYLDEQISQQVIIQINKAEPHLLLVGMGNPIQENWIHKNRKKIKADACLGIGGLLTYWAGDLQRAPQVFRDYGCEWIHLLLHQPQRFKRYVVGNPLFLFRVLLQKFQRRG